MPLDGEEAMMNVEDAAEVQRLHQEAARMKQEAEITMTVANNLVSNAAANIAHNVRPPGRDHISMRPPVCGSDFRSFVFLCCNLLFLLPFTNCSLSLGINIAIFPNRFYSGDRTL